MVSLVWFANDKMFIVLALSNMGTGRLKTRDWKTWHRQKYRGGKRGTGKPGTNSQGWKTKE